MHEGLTLQNVKVLMIAVSTTPMDIQSSPDLLLRTTEAQGIELLRK